MPGNYNGDGSVLTARQQIALSCPVDGDARNAESVNAALRKSADFIDWLMDNVAILGAAVTQNNAPLRIQPAAETTPSLETYTNVASRRLIGRFAGGAGVLGKIRFYVTSNSRLEITINAEWSGAQWVKDAAADATRLSVLATISGKPVIIEQHIGIGTPFADAAWTQGVIGVELWTAMVLTSGWTNPSANFNSASYRKDISGKVHLKGYIQGNNSGGANPIFTFPAAYRPAKDVLVAACEDGASAVHVLKIESATGKMYRMSGSTSALLSIENLGWWTD